LLGVYGESAYDRAAQGEGGDSDEVVLERTRMKSLLPTLIRILILVDEAAAFREL
jgi:hypothetical protein